MSKGRHRDGQRAASRWAKGGIEMGKGRRRDGLRAASRRAKGALWSGTNKNRDVSAGPLARLFVCTAVLTRSLAQFVYSLAHGKVNF